MLDKQGDQIQEQTLRDQFNALEREIEALRSQQKAILTALEEPNLLETNSMNKAQWVEIMKHSGFNEEDMANWHRQFERMQPDAHQEFLESLNISCDEIAEIRINSR
ncbi:hypothetical protein AAFX24_08955 [Vibrio mediterranei]|uniref:hypothetical protein n=1 Tax=Vibrio mediterranei TaxID=689 RepID=UPI0038CE02BE